MTDQSATQSFQLIVLGQITQYLRKIPETLFLCCCFIWTVYHLRRIEKVNENRKSDRLPVRECLSTGRRLLAAPRMLPGGSEAPISRLLGDQNPIHPG